MPRLTRQTFPNDEEQPLPRQQQEFGAKLALKYLNGHAIALYGIIVAILSTALGFGAKLLVLDPIKDLNAQVGTLSTSVANLDGMFTMKVATIDLENLSPEPAHSSAQLRQAASLFQQAKESKVKVDSAGLSSVVSRLAAAAVSHGSQGEYWNAVGSLISYRSAAAYNFPSVTPQADCFTSPTPDDYTANLDASGMGQAVGIVVADCRINLNDIARYKGSKLEQETDAMRRVKGVSASSQVIWFLSNVDVVIGAEQIIPGVNQIRFKECRFHVSLDQQPPSSTRFLAERLFASLDPKSVEVTFSNEG